MLEVCSDCVQGKDRVYNQPHQEHLVIVSIGSDALIFRTCIFQIFPLNCWQCPEVNPGQAGTCMIQWDHSLPRREGHQGPRSPQQWHHDLHRAC